MPRVGLVVSAVTVISLASAGCHRWFIQDADREVQKLIETRQRAALGETRSADPGAEDGRVGAAPSLYSFVPHPVDLEVPEAFRRRPSASAQRDATVRERNQPVPTSQPVRQRQVFTLADALAYAMRHAREFQFAKEDLYLAALDLTLERHLWTPQFVGEVSAEFADYGQVHDFDRAMTAVAQVGASQRLPYGGEVTARVINTLMRDLGVHTTSGESGQMILEADIPLFRGAGRVAYESRYQAERNLIYAVRTFERFRRSFLVTVASDYFDLLSVKAEIESARESERALRDDVERSRALADAGEGLQVDADRAEVDYLIAQNDAINATAAYNSALDRFKILLGMPTDTPIEAVEPELDLVAPEVPEAEATATALRYRLDLLNEQDFIDDARRGVLIARNNLLPELNLGGSVTMDTDPNRKNSFSYNTERTTWRGEVALEIPLDRKAERNDYRSALIDLRRAERDYDLMCDLVRLDVRDALRGLEEARVSMKIQRKSIEINRFRADQARTLYDKGLLPSNRDVVEAENGLRTAKNRFARAQSDYRAAVLEFLRDTGTLRVDDNGRLITFETAVSAPAGNSQ